MINDSLKYLVALTAFPKFGPVRITKLDRYFKTDYQAAFTASPQMLTLAGIESNLADEFVAAKRNIDPDDLREKLAKENILVMDKYDSDYPRLLLEIYDPPALLYFRGVMKKEELAVAVVGTRKFTSYGQQVVATISRELAQAGITIASGLALGIDTAAHNACLAVGGRTIAVLGTGLDKQSIYPSANRYLVEKIVAAGGLVLTEFPLGTQPLKHHFPQRNRIISGLSLGTLVVEANERSGALITAHHALDQNREVFAVPGGIYSAASVGTNQLIKQGARMVSCASEIIEALDLRTINAYIDNKKVLPESPEEEIIIAQLTHEPTHIDELIRLSGLSAPVTNSTLIIMEMKGMVRNLGGMKYVLAK